MRSRYRVPYELPADSLQYIATDGAGVRFTRVGSAEPIGALAAGDKV